MIAATLADFHVVGRSLLVSQNSVVVVVDRVHIKPYVRPTSKYLWPLASLLLTLPLVSMSLVGLTAVSFFIRLHFYFNTF